MIRNSNGWLRKGSFSINGVTLGRSAVIKAKNHLGYEVQELIPGKGWVSAIQEQVGWEADGDTPIYKPMVVATQGLAEDLMNEMKVMPGRVQNELRVYEAIEFPVNKA